MDKWHGCGCGCNRPLLEPWHVLAPDCWSLVTPRLRKRIEIAPVRGRARPRYVRLLKEAVREARQFRQWRAEVDACLERIGRRRLIA